MRTYTRKNVIKECVGPIEGVMGLCRLCLREAKDSIPIFGHKNDLCTLLATRIMICVGYEITREDCLPEAICIECHKELNRYYEFRKKCDTTYHKLKKHLLAVQATKKNNELIVKQEEQKTNLFEGTLVCPIPQSDCPVSESICTISQTVGPINQTMWLNSQSAFSTSQTICAASQSNSTEVQAVNLDNRSNCPVIQSAFPISQTICASSQSIKQSDSTAGQSNSTNVQAVTLDNRSNCPVSQSTTSVVSHLVTMSRDELLLAFEKPLEIIQTELQQNGLDYAASGNGWIDEAHFKKGVEETVQSSPMEVSMDVAEFLSAILIELGVLKRQENEVLVTEECRTIQIETGDGEHITMEVVQIEEEEQKTTATNKKAKVKRKSIKDVTKHQKDERPRCAVCGRQFASGAVLRRHARTHTGERPFRCARCGRSFSQRAVLTRHELVHREVRPFACARCPKSFTQRNALAAHARRHEPAAAREPRHQCARCPKRFLHASGLSRHLKSHLGRVSSCAQCARLFADESSLRRHARLKHAPPPAPQDI